MQNDNKSCIINYYFDCHKSLKIAKKTPIMHTDDFF